MRWRGEVKTLFDVVSVTEARGAQAIITTARGSPTLKDCLMIMAIPGSDTKVHLTGILVGPYYTVDDASFEYYLADLDDLKTWLSSGVEPPRRPIKKEV
jgi:hypothetical protein